MIDDTFYQTKLLGDDIDNFNNSSNRINIDMSSPHYHHHPSSNHNHISNSHYDHHLQNDHHSYEYDYDQYHSPHAPHHPHEAPEYSYKESDQCTDSQPPFYKIRTNIET